MGNTDNHGRNTAFIKTYESIQISPLFDFAPMVLDDSGIPRATKWKSEKYHIPNFFSVQKTLVQNGIAEEDANNYLRDSLDRLGEVRKKLKEKGMGKDIIQIATKKYDEFMKSFKEYIGTLK